LKEKSAACSQPEWEAIINGIFFDGDPVSDIDVVAKVVPDDHIEIGVRRQVQGIKVRAVMKRGR
jgi:hypothetical protein